MSSLPIVCIKFQFLPIIFFPSFSFLTFLGETCIKERRSDGEKKEKVMERRKKSVKKESVSIFECICFVTLVTQSSDTHSIIQHTLKHICIARKNIQHITHYVIQNTMD